MSSDVGKLDPGIEYQLKIITYIAGCLSKENVQDYWIYTNREVNPLDDIVVKFTDGRQYFIYFCQIKYRYNENDVNLHFRHFSKESMRNKGEFKLVKANKFIDLQEYLEKIHKIMNENERGEFLKELLEGVPESNIEFWLFSNSSFWKPNRWTFDPFQRYIMLNGVRCFLRPYPNYQSIVPPRKNGGTCYRFITTGHGQLPCHLEKCYVFLKQPGNNDVASSIGNLNIDLLTKEPAQDMINFVTLNLKRATNVTMLRKNIFETHLLSLCLTHFIVEPTEAFVMKPELAKIWNELVTRFDVTLTSSERKPYLYGCLSRKIREHFGDFDWNKIIRGSYVIPEAKTIEEKLKELVRNTEIEHWLGNCDRIQDLLKTLWECEYLPLVLSGNFNVSILNKYRHLGKRFVLLADNGISNSDLRVFASAADIHEIDLGREFLKSIDISMQGREPIQLFSILNGDMDLMKEFKCEHLLYLIRKRDYLIRSVEGSDNSKIILENGNYFYIKNGNGGEQVVPIIGKCFQDTEKYLKRRLCKPTVEETIRDSERKVICFLTGDLNSINWTRRNYYNLLDESMNNIVSTIELQIKQGQSAFIGIKNEHVEGLWSQFSSSEHALLHIKVERGRMILLKHLTNINSYISYDGPKFNAETFFEETSTGITVITGEPGSGKSTLLRSLFNACDKHSFALFCDLKNYRQDLYERDEDLFKNPIDFILRKEEEQLTQLSNKQYSNQHLNFLRKFLDKTKQLVLFLDSFDEVLPEYEEQVLDFIRILNKSNRRCIIASRLDTAYILGESLEVTLLKIDTLSETDIEEYLSKELPDSNLDEYPLEFRENPLFLGFLITLKRENALPSVINPSSLYNAIIDQSIKHLFHEKNKWPIPRQNYGRWKKRYLKIYKKLALLEIFGDTVIAELNLNYTTLRDNIMFGDNSKLGLIVQFNEKGPIFLHRTIAEFLVAEWVIENIDKDRGKSMYAILLKHHWRHIRYILDDILCRNLALHQAVIQEDLPKVKTLCSADDKYLREVDKWNRSALDVAAIRCTGYIMVDLDYLILEEIVHHMILKQINSFERNSGTNSHWTYYLSRRHEIFLQQASDCNLTHTTEMYFYCKNEINAGITWCIEQNMLDTAMALLKKDISLADSCFSDFLLKVISEMRTDLLFELIEFKSSTNPEFDELCRACRNLLPIAEVSKLANLKMEDWGFTAIHIACMSGSADVVRELIRLGVDVNAVDAFELQPLYYAIDTCSIEILTILAKSIKREANILDRWGSPVFPNYLHRCIRKNYWEIAKILLLDEGFDRDEKDERGRTALHIAVKKCRKKSIYKYILRNREMDIPKPDDDDPINQIEFLLEHELNVDAQDNRGETPLHIAIECERLDVIELFLRHGANPNIEGGRFDRTPLYIAVGNKNHEAVTLLLKYGADINQADRYGKTALFALRDDYDDYDDIDNSSSIQHILKALVNMGADVNHQDNDGDTALMIAIDRNFPEIATMLLENGVDVNLQNKHGNTALHKAVRACFVQFYKARHISSYELFEMIKDRDKQLLLLSNMEIIEILLKGGTDKQDKIKDARARTAADLLKVLIEKGANVDAVNGRGRTALDVAIKYQTLISLGEQAAGSSDKKAAESSDEEAAGSSDGDDHWYRWAD